MANKQVMRETQIVALVRSMDWKNMSFNNTKWWGECKSVGYFTSSLCEYKCTEEFGETIWNFFKLSPTVFHVHPLQSLKINPREILHVCGRNIIFPFSNVSCSKGKFFSILSLKITCLFKSTSPFKPMPKCRLWENNFGIQSC